MQDQHDDTPLQPASTEVATEEGLSSELQADELQAVAGGPGIQNQT